MIWGLTSCLSLISIVSRNLWFAEYSEIVPAGKLSLSVSRVIIVCVICAVLLLLVYLTVSHCSWMESVDVEGRRYRSNLALSLVTVFAPWLLSYWVNFSSALCLQHAS